MDGLKETMNGKWVTAVETAGLSTFVSSEDGFHSCEGPLEGSWGKREKICGIYCWITENGQSYVGKSVNIRSRLRTHFRTHPDLTHAAFMEVAPECLDAREGECVGKIEQAFPMRNVMLTKATASHRPFDDFMSLEEQKAFIRRGNQSKHLRSERRQMPLLLARQAANLRHMEKDSEITSIARKLVTAYVCRAVPDPLKTENRFWSVTYFRSGEIVARVNVGQQEVFTVHCIDEGILVRVLSPKTIGWTYEGPLYVTDSYASVLSMKRLKSLMDDSRHLVAIREMNIWLARHSTALNLRSHCPHLFEIEEESGEPTGSDCAGRGFPAAAWASCRWTG